jgi:hypothetical protein
MMQKIICVATKEECPRINCKRRHLPINKHDQSYMNFSLMDCVGGEYPAYISYNKNYIYPKNKYKD